MKILCLVLLLMGLVATAVCLDECPSTEEIHPCTCEMEHITDESEVFSTMIVTCDKPIRKFQKLKYIMNALRSKSNVKLNFTRLNLGTIPSNFFYGIEVKSLNIHDCELDSVTDRHDRRPFSGLENTLEELIITYSISDKNNPMIMRLDHMKRLKKLVLSYNTIKKLRREWFQDGPESLEVVIISNNHMDEFQDNTFERLLNLKKLIFEGNLCGVHSEVLKWNMLPMVPKLSYARFDSNCIQNLPGDAFKHMPAPKTISLRYNKIRRLEQNPWRHIWERAEEIHLEGNPLECDSHMDWLMSLNAPEKLYGKCRGTERDLREYIKGKWR